MAFQNERADQPDFERLRERMVERQIAARTAGQVKLPCSRRL